MEVRENDAISDILHRIQGLKKPITLVLDQGVRIEGTIQNVFSHLIVLKLKGGRSFFDSIIRIDKILAVEYQARES